MPAYYTTIARHDSDPNGEEVIIPIAVEFSYEQPELLHGIHGGASVEIGARIRGTNVKAFLSRGEAAEICREIEKKVRDAKAEARLERQLADAV